MRLALRLARRGQGRVEPNPMVGAVLVRDGGVVATGYHRRFGGPHAEVEAIREARRRGIDPAACTLYVTLEPCCHHGKTPPCVDAILDAGIGRVVAAMVDPFPKVAGGGIGRLRKAGVNVTVGLCQGEAADLNAPFIKRLATGLPWVIAKWAQTIDGRIATATGDSRWISGPESRRHVHRLRGRVDAIMVGVGTVIADDPQLTARDVPVRRVARRVIVDPSFRMPPQSRLLASADQAPVTVAVRDELLIEPSDALLAAESRGVEFVGLPPADGGGMDLRPLLSHLVRVHQATNVLVEGGATLTGALLAQGLVDQTWVFVSPRLFGDSTALPAVTGLACPRVEDGLVWRLDNVRRFEQDVLLTYRMDASPARPPQG